jgi:hypothetical protein
MSDGELALYGMDVVPKAYKLRGPLVVFAETRIHSLYYIDAEYLE